MEKKHIKAFLIVGVLLVVLIAGMLYALEWDIEDFEYDDIFINSESSQPGTVWWRIQDFTVEGNRFYELGSDGKIHQFSCTTDWELSSCSYDNKNISSNGAEDIYVSESGQYIFGVDNGADDVFRWSCSTPWDIESCSIDQTINTLEPNEKSLFFSSGGQYLYEFDGNSELIYQRNCSDSWNLSSCSGSLESLNPNEYLTDFYITSYNEGSGENLYIMDAFNNEAIFEYNCTEPWNISTCSYIGESYDPGTAKSSGFYMKEDGTRLYETNELGRIRQHSTPTFIRSCQQINSPGKYRLVENISSSGTCIIINASNIVFNGYGNKISYNSGGTDSKRGIRINPYFNNINITNVTIEQNSTSGISDGILVQDYTNNTKIYDNKIITSEGNGINVNWYSEGHNISNNFINITGGSYFGGIGLSDIKGDTIVEKNKIYSTATFQSGTYGGITIGNINKDGSNFIIKDNYINTRNNHGLYLSANSYDINNTIVKNNSFILGNKLNGIYITGNNINNLTIFDNYISNSNISMYFSLDSNTKSINVSNNVLNKSINKGVFLSKTNDLTFDSNTIKNRKEGDYAYGIQIEGLTNSSITNNIIDNFVEGNGSYGIEISDTPYPENYKSRYLNISNNNITNKGNGYLNTGIKTINSYNLTFFNNNITTNGTFGNRGLWLEQETNLTTIEKNNIKSQGITNSNSHAFSFYAFGDYLKIKLINNTLESVLGDDLNFDDSTYGIELINQKIKDYGLSGNPLIFENTNYGKIDFLEGLTGSGNYLSNEINISNNSVKLNDSNSNLNKPANITLYDIGDFNFSNPFIYRNNDVCTENTTPSCYNYTSLTAQDVIFNVSGWSEYFIGEDDKPPIINIVDPKNKNYAYNESLPLNYTVKDELSELSSCWYKVVNETGSLIIDNTTLINCTNSTFDLPGGDVDYDLTLYANDTNGNLNSSIRNFGVRTESPAIELYHPGNGDEWLDYSENIVFNFTATKSEGIDTCELYGNWTGTWKVNETFNNVESGNITNTTKNISDSVKNKWNVWCNDTLGNEGWALENYTFSIDTINPNISIDYISTTKGSQTINFNTTVSDTNLKECYYSIYGDNDTIDGLNSNVSFTCNQEDSATVSDFGTYELVTWAEDEAGNTDKDNQSFTTQEEEVAGGGGGGETTVINQSNWTYAVSSAGGQRYEIRILPGDTETRTLYFENLGDEEREITLTCQERENSSIDMCQYISLEDDQFTLPVAKEEFLTTNFDISIPEDFEKGQYSFNLLAVDDRGIESTVTVLVDVPSGFFNIIVTKLTSNAINTLVFLLSVIILPILIFNVVLGESKIKGKGVISFIGGFALSILILALI